MSKEFDIAFEICSNDLDIDLIEDYIHKINIERERKNDALRRMYA